jgi:hypothetical protein
MYLDQSRASAIIGAIWLFGLAALFYTGYWWPGIMFVIGLAAIVEGLVHGHGWYALQGGLWAIGIGAWALFDFSLAVLFVLLGISVLLGAFVRPPMLQKKPAPVSHDGLE